MDGVNSARRYINKNFRDDERQVRRSNQYENFLRLLQEAIDLFLGRFSVEKWNLVTIFNSS